MIKLRRSQDRGHLNFGWLDTYHSFSFGEYHDENFMGFRSLRVLNDDRIAARQGFATHSHRDMEIISYIAEGTLSHKDSMGNGSDIRAGEVQYMSAGSGVTHSEFNHSDALVHLIQIWILPDEKSATPRYGQQKTNLSAHRNQLKLLCSKTGRDQSIAIRQTADLYGAFVDQSKTFEHRFALGGYGYLHLVKGEGQVGDQKLSSGDAIFLSQESSVQFQSLKDNTEILLFDLD